MTTTAAPKSGAIISEAEWQEREWHAVATLLPALVDNVPSGDDSLDVRANAVAVAEEAAVRLAGTYPAGAPGRPGRDFLAAITEVRRQNPEARPLPAKVPHTVAGAAMLASRLALDPASVDGFPVELLGTLDAVLGTPVVGRYVAAVAAAREQLAQDADDVLGRIPVQWRREANAPTRAEAAELIERQRATGPEDWA